MQIIILFSTAKWLFQPHTHVLFLDFYTQTATLTPKSALEMSSHVLKAYDLHSDKVFRF